MSFPQSSISSITVTVVNAVLDLNSVTFDSFCFSSEASGVSSSFPKSVISSSSSLGCSPK